MKTVLVIEDNEDSGVLITRLLEKAGYRTRMVQTGLEGLDLAERDRPDFILLDIQLPDIDGKEVLRRLRESKVGATIPVIAVTSCAMAGDREKLLAAGCNGYIEKPIDPEGVIEQIRSILGEIE
jgi:two-component system, cell cycle response regulator DivK